MNRVLFLFLSKSLKNLMFNSGWNCNPFQGKSDDSETNSSTANQRQAEEFSSLTHSSLGKTCEKRVKRLSIVCLDYIFDKQLARS